MSSYRPAATALPSVRRWATIWSRSRYPGSKAEGPSAASNLDVSLRGRPYVCRPGVLRTRTHRNATGRSPTAGHASEDAAGAASRHDATERSLRAAVQSRGSAGAAETVEGQQAE